MPVQPVGPAAAYYKIEVGGRLSQEWAEWFGDMAIAGTHTEEGATITVLSGPVTDRAALFGILNRIRDLGLKLISVNQVGG